MKKVKKISKENIKKMFANIKANKAKDDIFCTNKEFNTIINEINWKKICTENLDDVFVVLKKEGVFSKRISRELLKFISDEEKIKLFEIARETNTFYNGFYPSDIDMSRINIKIMPIDLLNRLFISTKNNAVAKYMIELGNFTKKQMLKIAQDDELCYDENLLVKIIETEKLSIAEMLQVLKIYIEGRNEMFHSINIVNAILKQVKKVEKKNKS